jgi:lipoprotein-releasing system permease protein
MRTLFSIVYLVCGALIVAIFWAIVYEKTRDIGILRSIGASRAGIVSIFLLYGLFVGVFGALGGVGLGWLVTTNMPNIHEGMSHPPLWLGIVLVSIAGLLGIWSCVHWHGRKLLPLLLGTLGAVVLGALGVGELWLRSSGGVVLWDPAVYYFTEIPSEVDWASAWITAVAAAVVSVVAAAIPAARAADIDPVGALRYE